jgi:N utilization substance protein B
LYTCIAMSSGTRRSGRVYALQLLYARDGDPATDVAGAAVSWAEAFDLDVDPQAQLFARELVAAAAEHGPALDELIASASKNWRIDRMSRVDRNILRLGACELLAFRGVPVKVVINEAVELAKRFGTAESSAFVNGVLDRIAGAVGRQPED